MCVCVTLVSHFARINKSSVRGNPETDTGDGRGESNGWPDRTTHQISTGTGTDESVGSSQRPVQHPLRSRTVCARGTCDCSRMCLASCLCMLAYMYLVRMYAMYVCMRICTCVCVYVCGT